MLQQSIQCACLEKKGAGIVLLGVGQAFLLLSLLLQHLLVFVSERHPVHPRVESTGHTSTADKVFGTQVRWSNTSSNPTTTAPTAPATPTATTTATSTTPAATTAATGPAAGKQLGVLRRVDNRQASVRMDTGLTRERGQLCPALLLQRSHVRGAVRLNQLIFLKTSLSQL